MNDVDSHLKRLHDQSRHSVDASLAACRGDLGAVLQLDSDLARWESALSDWPSTRQLQDGRKHLGLAVFAATCGLYGQAFGSLRTFLELSFASVQFSADELLRRQWLADRQDVSWSTLLSPESGVLSAVFVREFNEDAIGDAAVFARTAKQIYRECSQFAHGKLSHSSRLPATLTFSEGLLKEWSDSACRAAECVLFSLFCRFGVEVLHGDLLASLGETLEHSFLRLPVVRASLGMPVEAP